MSPLDAEAQRLDPPAGSIASTDVKFLTDLAVLETLMNAQRDALWAMRRRFDELLPADVPLPF